MAAAFAVTPYDGLRDNVYRARKIPPQRTGLDEACEKDGHMFTESKWRCDTLCMQRDPTGEAFTPLASLLQAPCLDSYWNKINKDRIFLDTTLLPSDFALEAPPSYIDSTDDKPPAYARAHSQLSFDDVQGPNAAERKQPSQNFQIKFEPKLPQYKDAITSMNAFSLNLDDTSNVRQAKGGKKASKAQKQANKNSSWESGDEGNKDPGGGEENGRGGDGGSNGAAGGDGGGDGGGGDDWNDWSAPSNKKKKGKKNKGGADEDEEKKNEDEAEKDNAEEDAGNGDPLSWANGGDTNQDDEWGGFTSAKKGKKAKKDKAPDPTPDTAANNPSIGTFDDINLGDSPQLDLNFGDTGTKGTGSSFGFGGWGGTWGTTTSKWDFSAADTGGTDITDKSKDTKDTSLDGDSGIWSFGSSKKNKKKTTSAGFDFGLGALDETKEDDTSKTADADSWGGFAPAGGKSKKDKKKNAFEDIGTEPDISRVGTALEEPTTTADDSWGKWGTASASTNKKKGKKGGEEEKPPVPLQPSTVPRDASADDDWGGFSSKKNKKKGKNAVTEEHVEEPPNIVDSKVEPEADDGWGSFGNKKDKKKAKKNQVEEKHQDLSTIEFGEKGKETDEGADLGWGGFDNGKRGKKKGNANAFGTQMSEHIVEKEPDPEPDLSFDFGGKKGKKGKKGTAEDPITTEPAVTMLPEAETTVDKSWGAFGSKKDKDKKKSKKGIVEDTAKSDDVNIVEVPDPESFDDFGWGSITKKDKKGRKDSISEVIDDPIVAVKPEVAAGMSVLDDDYINGWGSTDKKGKKGKKSGAAVDASKLDAAPPPPPPPPVEPEPSAFDSWGTANKTKKGKKGKVAEPDPYIVAVPDPPEERFDTFEEEVGGWGLSAKDKKKMEKEREKDRKGKEEKEKAEQEQREKEERERAEQEEKEKAEEEEKEKAEKDKAKSKGKPGKKGKATAAQISKTRDIMTDSVPDAAPAVMEEDSWGTWEGPTKKDKNKGSKNAMPDVPPPVPSPPVQGLTPELELIPGLDDPGDDEWASFVPAKSKGKKDVKPTSKASKAEEAKAAKKAIKDKADSSPADSPKDDLKKNDVAKEESAAKAAKSFWGGTGTASTAKSKTSKDKDASEPRDLTGLDSLLDDEITGIMEDPAPTSTKKGSKSKGDSKLGKVGSKECRDSAEKKTSDEALLDDLLEGGIENEQLAGAVDEEGDDKKDDAWSFWGSKKTSGKKADELPKEIAKPGAANQKGSLKNNFKKEKEPESESKSAAAPADEASQSQPSKASKTTMSTSTSKSTAKSSVLQRVKDLEKEKEKEKSGGKARDQDSDATAEPQPPAPEIEPLPKPETAPLKKSSAAGSKSKASKTDTKKKDPSPPAARNKDTSTVPGSFPGESPEDDLLDLLNAPPVDKKSANKPAKAKKEPKQETVMDMMDDFNFDAPAPEAPLTPPAEPVAAKPAKKERARVVKNEGASSWGFWGAAPKKDAKKDTPSKDDADPPAPKPKEKRPVPGLSRSKSTKTVKGKDKEIEKSSKSSGSDEKEKKSESRPSKSRGSSFGGFFGGPPPVRAKTVRRNSTAASKTASSHRQSMDVDAIGLPSPPADETPEMSSKAAKLMGTAKLDRKTSTRGKQKAKGSASRNRPLEQEGANTQSAVPDPYAIDDDDIVMVGALDEPISDVVPPQEPITKVKKDKASKSKPKRETKLSPEVMDDVVMVEVGSPQGELDSGARETLAFDERPRPQRSNTSAKKPKTGVMGGLFGFGKSRRISDTMERPRSKGILTDEERTSRRKRTVAGGDDSAKRLRRDDRKVSRSDREDRAAEGYVYDAPADGGVGTEAEDAEARKERRAKRAATRKTEVKDSEDRRARRREAEQAAEDARQLKAKEAQDRRARKEEEAEAIRLEDKRARRAARAEMNTKLAAAESATRPEKSDRRRSHMDQPMVSGANNDAERRARREARRATRTPGEKGSRRKTTELVNDYFDPRNGGNGQEPYLHGANDHTSSWVKSQISDPAPPPPVEGTVIEPIPVLGGADDAAVDEDALRRAKHKPRRQSRYVDMPPEEEELRRRRKDREIRSSEGSREDDAGKPYASQRKSDFVSGMRGLDTRPSLAAGGKRGSWLKRVSGF